MDSNSSYPSSSDPLTLQPLPEIRFPRFPTVQELADQHQSEQDRPRPRAQGTFEALLGDPRILHVAWLENPDAFDPRLGPILQELLTGQTLQNLDPQSLGLLDAATLDFAQYRPAKAAPPPPPPRPLPQDQDDGDGPLAWQERGSGAGQPGLTPEIKETTLPTRWWERR